MLINSNTVLIGENITLVPYEVHHVKKYHEWMQNEDILMLTASEPLTLEEEYDMQKKWQMDEDKITFILLDNKILDSRAHSEQIEVDSMVGDINVFLNDELDKSFGEIEVMIAEENARRKGFGIEAINIMMSYCTKNIKVTSFCAKIGMMNQPSIKLFKDKLGFHEISNSEVFKEITLRKCMQESDPKYNYIVSNYKEWKM